MFIDDQVRDTEEIDKYILYLRINAYTYIDIYIHVHTPTSTHPPTPTPTYTCLYPFCRTGGNTRWSSSPTPLVEPVGIPNSSMTTRRCNRKCKRVFQKRERTYKTGSRHSTHGSKEGRNIHLSLARTGPGWPTNL